MKARENHRIGVGPADKAAREGPNPRERIQGQKSPLNTPGPGRFILTNPAAKGPVDGPTGPRKILKVPDVSKSIEGMETVKTKRG